MCNICEINPVYEFTNKKKLCKNCFIKYFDKKVLFTIRKYKLINPKDVVGYNQGNNFREVVLKKVLEFIAEKYGFNVVKLPNKKVNKIAVPSTLDSAAYDLLNLVIKRNISNIKKNFPFQKNIIKPLYFFLDKEVLLYAKLKSLKYKDIKKNNKVNIFLNNLEKKHLEVKRAIINGILKLYN
jgi:tRNA(Ile)-lysidine synthase TilS/MesJ